jgi:hypothetical protein
VNCQWEDRGKSEAQVRLLSIRVRVTQIYACSLRTTQLSCDLTGFKFLSFSSNARFVYTRDWQSTNCINSEHHYHDSQMASQSRASKRTYSQRSSEEGALITRSQPLCSTAAKRRQSKLLFSQPTLRESPPRKSLTPPPQPSPSQSPSRESSILPSESASHVSRARTSKILASRRCHFDIDFSELQGFTLRPPTLRSMHTGKISWIYMHGTELEKMNTKGTWTRYWLCRQCYDNGLRRPMPTASTTSCGIHLQSQHLIYPPGRAPQASTSTSASVIDQYREVYHPLYAEHWQTSFINWIVTNDISFEAATDPLLHEVILHGGPSVKDLLRSRPTFRKWLMTTYTERLHDVKESIANGRSLISYHFLVL